MNLYDLSIGEDKMNQFLSIALKTHFEIKPLEHRIMIRHVGYI